jgi:hypothetical protein
MRSTRQAMPLKAGLVILAAAMGLGGCGDECRSYSAFTCKEIETADYNVYFYFPSDTEHYLGQASGLSECGATAHSYAIERKVSAADWGYVCCMIARGSSCYEKHR